MRKNPFIRWQLLALGGITLLLLYRVISGPPPREGLVVLERMDAHSVHDRTFEVDRSIQVAIEGKGSFESKELSNGSLAAYAWIIDAETREVIWQMDAENAIRGNGTIADIQDELKLEAGIYQLFFASYGNRLRDRHYQARADDAIWEEESGEWYVALNLLEGKETDIRRLDRFTYDSRPFVNERVVWQSGPVVNRKAESFLFSVDERTPFKIRSLGEISDDEHDFGYIENQLTKDRVWQFKFDNSVPAGGVTENRQVAEEIYLDPGVYEVVYQTDATHAFGNWKGNPPYDPVGWGITLTTRDTSKPVSSFDPWQSLKPAITMMPFENDQFQATTFRTSQKQRVFVYGLGEMKSSDRYDYGWIERGALNPGQDHDYDDLRPNRDRSVWEMDYDDSEPAGGDKSNRLAMAFVDLPPDVYTVYYRTDGSHSAEDWSNGEPGNGERWGIALFGLNDQAQSDIQVLDHLAVMLDEEGDEEEAYVEEVEEIEDGIAFGGELAIAPAPPIPPVPATLHFNPSDILISLNKLGNDQHVKAELELQGWSKLHIVAVGEITTSGNQYDYGYITRAGDGEVVWEMNMENTDPAGGDEANRIFNGDIELAAGQYIVHFKTDATHSFSEFNTPPPAMPEAWGITIARAD